MIDGMNSEKFSESSIDLIREFCSQIINGTKGTDEYEFYMNGENVLYVTSPDSDDIQCATYVDLTTKDLDWISKFLNEDIIRTYLGTGDIAVSVSSIPDTDNVYVSLTDRSTGCSLLGVNNLLDQKILDTYAEIVNNNTDDNVTPYEIDYKEVKPESLNISESLVSNSYRRLHSMFQDIYAHVLSHYTGHDIYTRDDM